MKNKIWIPTLMVLLLIYLPGIACEVCKKQQPKILRGVTHGVGPQSDWDYVWVGSIVVIVLVSLFFSIKWIIHPGEKNMDHIKHSILN